MIKVSIIGASGYSGIYLVYALLSRKDVELIYITSQSNAGKLITDVFPSFNKFSAKKSIIFEKLDEEQIASSSDVVFLCLPHGKSSLIVSSILNHNPLIKIIDIGADFRFDKLENYELNYEKHTAPDLNKYFIYGLADIYEDKIKGSQFVSNPGCYPTGALLPLLPLIKAGIINYDYPIIIDSKSGISGAGKSINLVNQFCEAQNSVRAYNIWKHRHLPEIKEKVYNEIFLQETEFESVAGSNIQPLSLPKPNKYSKSESLSSQDKYPDVIFTPHVIPVIRGIFTTIYVKLNTAVIDDNKIEDIYNNFYKNNLFVILLKNGILPNIKNVIYSNNCHIAFSKNNNYLILVSAIDNLGKGASLQAIQNMNLMFGLSAGYEMQDFTPYP